VAALKKFFERKLKQAYQLYPEIARESKITQSETKKN